ncbi:sigma-54-dependent Fis family transcriptional regulator [Sphingobacterium multivorum]|uniref:sigma-54-dependent transcriptional regulator n=1 Tax=Sphingobacterium sp. 40-24 TaxID=1895843 RepID=UPI001915AB7C|nr:MULTISPECIES: sigma-54 dependent transcriptional regulator [Sphingobacterium]QQT47794.1 sigma-54-dependent Fis family transcriptional regulator [Sphingobacterium multivorum]QQT64401.1 sigma-54-dependent Fis family transcriptional regulator [Sphingobacterium multivorum]QRQ64003.1 sigma-54-dependent Fis family transcriptional regulator [Sphingobacterium multivorum]
MVNRVLLIDDEEKLRKLLAKIISLEGFDVIEAADIKSGLKKLEVSDVDVVLCDVKLPDGNGVETAKLIKERYPIVEIILLTAYGNIPDGVRAIKNGAFEYITKGDDNNRIIPLLYKACEKVALARRVEQLEKRLGDRLSFDKIIGKSSAIKAAIGMAQKVAVTNTTVLLTGETGTGKEVFAQAIHQASSRRDRSFVAINCAAFTKDLLENELFGHKSGAFTGATKDQRGLFEEAHLGTIFLDEVGEMALELQAKILRVLETGEFLKVGDSKPTKVDVRIIAATNRNLETEIASDHFRSDLFYRLSVFTIELPPLRERIEDIATLAQYYADIFALKSNLKPLQMTPEFVQALEGNLWRGNIRELKNVIERSVILSEGGVLGVESLPFGEREYREGANVLSNFAMSNMERQHIQRVLKHTNGNKAEAARLLEIGIATLYRKIEEYRIQ